MRILYGAPVALKFNHDGYSHGHLAMHALYMNTKKGQRPPSHTIQMGFTPIHVYVCFGSPGVTPVVLKNLLSRFNHLAV